MKQTVIAGIALLCASSFAIAAPQPERDHDHGRDHGHEAKRDGHYRAPNAYHRPHGYRQQRWAHGERLPSSYRAHRYYITDYSRYHLRPPPRGYRWVRVDNDIVLVAVTTGLIDQVLQNFFY
ncbi:MAG: RcnB family protein [Rhodanobacteraceae bacterium]